MSTPGPAYASPIARGVLIALGLSAVAYLVVTVLVLMLLGGSS